MCKIKHIFFNSKIYCFFLWLIFIKSVELIFLVISSNAQALKKIQTKTEKLKKLDFSMSEKEIGSTEKVLNALLC